MGLFPISTELDALKKTMVDVGADPNALRNAVREFFCASGGAWELRAQLCTDLQAMPIEDASTVWPEDQRPYLPAARITAAGQDSPWHELAAHQPLGSVMRARKQTYLASARFRGERNGCPMHEPRQLSF
jgi:hypothetical protein